MLNKNEMRVLKALVGNINKDITLSDMCRLLKQKYPQTHRTVQMLAEDGLIRTTKVGKSKVIKLDFSKYHPEYALAEMERLADCIKNKDIALLVDRILKIGGQFTCVLFGSYASGKFTEKSDKDLLFIISDKEEIDKFERIAKNALSAYNADISAVHEESMFEMWANPQKLNVGNELFINHIVLVGAELFINLVRRHYVGR